MKEYEETVTVQDSVVNRELTIPTVTAEFA